LADVRAAIGVRAAALALHLAQGGAADAAVAAERAAVERGRAGDAVSDAEAGALADARRPGHRLAAPAAAPPLRPAARAPGAASAGAAAPSPPAAAGTSPSQGPRLSALGGRAAVDGAEAPRVDDAARRRHAHQRGQQRDETPAG